MADTRPRSAQPIPAGYRIRRALHDALRFARTDTRVVVLLGARQVGKSTLSRAIAAEAGEMTVASLDDATLRDAANNDPRGFLADRRRPMLIDEIQRAPELLLEIKDVVDADDSPGHGRTFSPPRGSGMRFRAGPNI